MTNADKQARALLRRVALPTPGDCWLYVLHDIRVYLGMPTDAPMTDQLPVTTAVAPPRVRRACIGT